MCVAKCLELHSILHSAEYVNIVSHIQTFVDRSLVRSTQIFEHLSR